MADRKTRERKLIALMVNDLGPGFGEKEMVGLEGEVRALPDDELRGTLATRLDLPPPPSTMRRSRRPSRTSRNPKRFRGASSPAPPT
ncbi:MAG: hypothetical protein H0U55_10560 [Rubrobacteraceae bacterium]|nr:hypothetical protein [Rubrobacteraceae bacterium]